VTPARATVGFVAAAAAGIVDDPPMTTKIFYAAIVVILVTALAYAAYTGNLLLAVMAAIAIALGAVAFRVKAQGGGRPPRGRR
jgi:hypothetical protein